MFPSQQKCRSCGPFCQKFFPNNSTQLHCPKTFVVLPSSPIDPTATNATGLTQLKGVCLLFEPRKSAQLETSIEFPSQKCWILLFFYEMDGFLSCDTNLNFYSHQIESAFWVLIFRWCILHHYILVNSTFFDFMEIILRPASRCPIHRRISWTKKLVLHLNRVFP